jgi:hypothetical protein
MGKTVTMTDDYTGKPGTEADPATERKISIDGDVYKIDLTNASVAAFVKLADPFLSKATKTDAKAASTGDSASARKWANETDAGKAWVAANPKTADGKDSVTDSGRMPKATIAAYLDSLDVSGAADSIAAKDGPKAA